MERIHNLYSTTIGKKIVMAAASLVLVGFVIGHMVGNLKIFMGPESFNHYSEGLRTFGAPFLADSQALWLIRLILLAALLVHVVAAVQLWATSRAARSVPYKKFDPQVFSHASRTMKWGGVAILLFVVYHILHFTTGQAHGDFIPGNPYHNLVAGFQSPLIVLIYLAALTALALHVYHGTWSAFQTFGFSNPRYNSYRRPTALVLTVILIGGFAIVPLAVLLGIVG